MVYFWIKKNILSKKSIGSTYNKMNKQIKAIDNIQEALTIFKKMNLKSEVKTVQKAINHFKKLD